MCGIYGYVGCKKNTSYLLEQLEKLEYRGYDSCGVCYGDDNKIAIYKCVGNTNCLRKYVPVQEYTFAIGHTRWATHGTINKINAHPHIYKNYIIVHNGIISNYLKLKSDNNIIDTYSETDTEVVAHLLDKYSIEELFNILEGNYAILFINKNEPNKIYFMCNKCSLLICKYENNCYISSDKLAFPGGEALSLTDGSYGYFDNEKIIIKNIYGKKNDSYFKVENNIYAKRDKTNLLYEIYEQPLVIEKILNNVFNSSLRKKIKESKKIYFIGCGSSYYAAMYLAYIYNEIFKIESYAFIGSELYNRNDKAVLYIFISQSGETADLIKAYIDGMNAILLTNVINSTLARKIKDVCYINAYPELSVASTKAFMATIITGIAIIDEEKIMNINEIKRAVLNQLKEATKIKETAAQILKYKRIFILGTKSLYPLALEGALKIREISYLDSMGLASGELKHGTIALIDHNAFCITVDEIVTKELISRNALVIKPNLFGKGIAADMSYLVFVQLLANYLGEALNRNVDQPRNLAKSVTVE